MFSRCAGNFSRRKDLRFALLLVLVFQSAETCHGPLKPTIGLLIQTLYEISQALTQNVGVVH
jgi:hypothetical protein